MPRGNAPRSDDTRRDEAIAAEEKIARLLALMFVKDLPVQEQVGWLNAVGFGNADIARLLGIKSNHVKVALHRFKKQPRRRSISEA